MRDTLFILLDYTDSCESSAGDIGTFFVGADHKWGLAQAVCC
jgi:hypothetical protein